MAARRAPTPIDITQAVRQHALLGTALREGQIAVCLFTTAKLIDVLLQLKDPEDRSEPTRRSVESSLVNLRPDFRDTWHSVDNLATAMRMIGLDNTMSNSGWVIRGLYCKLTSYLASLQGF